MYSRQLGRWWRCGTHSGTVQMHSEPRKGESQEGEREEERLRKASGKENEKKKERKLW